VRSPVSAARRVKPQTEHRTIRTPDGTRIAYTWWRRPSKELLLLAPGFWRVRLARENLFLAEHFLRRGYDVAAIDFRGHGDSGGAYTFGPSERHDFLSVIDDLVGEGKPYSRFSVLGFSLGGSIAADTLARRPDLPCRALAMVCSPEHVGSLRPRPWKLGAAKQVRIRHVVRVPRISGRRASVSAAIEPPIEKPRTAKRGYGFPSPTRSSTTERKSSRSAGPKVYAPPLSPWPRKSIAATS